MQHVLFCECLEALAVSWKSGGQLATDVYSSGYLRQYVVTRTVHGTRKIEPSQELYQGGRIDGFRS